MTTIHQGQPIAHVGEKLEAAKAAMIMIHGRGGDVESILPLTSHFTGEGFAYFAPAANGNTWYPDRFLAPRANNEPNLSSALQAIDDVLKHIQTAGIPAEKTILLGFSQGACLSLEYAARNPQKFGGVVALSGGLIGANDELNGYTGSLNGTPVFIGCSDVDFHIPEERVHTSGEIMKSIGAEVDVRIYKGMGHTVNQDEIDAVNDLMARISVSE